MSFVTLALVSATVGRERGCIAMIIEITRPEAEALIEQRLRAGGFSSPEDMIFQALREFKKKQSHPASQHDGKFGNLSDLLLDLPFAGADLALDRSRDLPRSVDIR